MIVFSCLFPDLSLETLPFSWKNPGEIWSKNQATVLQQKSEKISHGSL